MPCRCVGERSKFLGVSHGSFNMRCANLNALISCCKWPARAAAHSWLALAQLSTPLCSRASQSNNSQEAAPETSVHPLSNLQHYHHCLISQCSMSAQVYEHGAHVTSWVCGSLGEQIFVSSKARTLRRLCPSYLRPACSVIRTAILCRRQPPNDQKKSESFASHMLPAASVLRRPHPSCPPSAPLPQCRRSLPRLRRSEAGSRSASRSFRTSAPSASTGLPGTRCVPKAHQDSLQLRPT